MIQTYIRSWWKEVSMFNCPNCWENPCVCGQEYQTWPDEKIRNQIEMLQNILNKRIDKNIDNNHKLK